MGDWLLMKKIIFLIIFIFSLNSFAQNFIKDFGIRGKTCKTHAANWTPQWTNVVGYWRFDGSGSLGWNTTVSAVKGPSGIAYEDDVRMNYSSSSSMYLFQGINSTPIYSFGWWYYDFINFGMSAGIGGLGPLTISFWGYLYDGTILYKSDGGIEQGWIVIANYSNANLQFRAYYGSGDAYRTTSNYLPSMVGPLWAHYTITWDGSNNGTGIKIYVNGVEPGYSTTVSGSGTRTSDSSRFLYLGQRGEIEGTTQYPFDGKIDELVIWNTALTALEVSSIYTAQKKCH